MDLLVPTTCACGAVLDDLQRRFPWGLVLLAEQPDEASMRAGHLERVGVRTVWACSRACMERTVGDVPYAVQCFAYGDR